MSWNARRASFVRKPAMIWCATKTALQRMPACACSPGYSSLGMGDESIAMVFAEVERVGEPRVESTEFIESFELPRAKVRAFSKRIPTRFPFAASLCWKGANPPFA